MNQTVISLKSPHCRNASIFGNKASSLHSLIVNGFKIPDGICISKYAYTKFISQTGIREKILMELWRKNFSDMRWEEMWDASLRIRNMFARAEMPAGLKKEIGTELKKCIRSYPVVIRSSSNAEDSRGASYAGVHESFVNIKGLDNILYHIKLVWASLWSDAALAYQKELSLDVDKNFMSVIIQRLVEGQKSGIAFSVNPENENQAVIEAVYGLNKGLVDGDVEPDRWFLSKKDGKVIKRHFTKYKKECISNETSLKIRNVNPSKAKKPVLTNKELKNLFLSVRQIENLQKSSQDIEWTIHKNSLYILQARPITSSRSKEKNSRRSWDLSLRRSFESLSDLSSKIEKELIPAMIQEAKVLSSRNLAQKSAKQLAVEISLRKKAFDRWKDVYWNDFIPFGHAMRLFGQIYNDRLRPKDPYEFIDLISSKEMKSVERNRALERLAYRVRKEPNLLTKQDKTFEKKFNRFIEKFSGASCDINKCVDERETLIAIIKEMAEAPAKKRKKSKKLKLLKKYLTSFKKEEKEFAKKLMELAKKSYRFRDDDNIYLGKFDSLLTKAMDESRLRLGNRCVDERACSNADEVINALKFPSYSVKKHNNKTHKNNIYKVHARQLRGQPAGEGIARGYARVIHGVSDLGKVKRNEIIVSDAIDPNMTFVIPIVNGIIERRGGMLIHGAIVAREYGLPCVTGIPDATSIIKTGDFVTVDGYYGLVIIHDKKSAV